MFRDAVQRNKCVSTLLGLSGKSDWCDAENGLNDRALFLLERYRSNYAVPLSTSELNIFLLATGLIHSEVRVNIWYLLSRLDLRNLRVVRDLFTAICDSDSSEPIDAWLEKYRDKYR